MGRVTAGQRIYDSELGAGRVIKVLKGGKQASVEFDALSGAHVREIGNLGVRIDCDAARICEGTRVLDPDYDLGRVVEVFSNGRVIVSFDRHDGVRGREASLLSKVDSIAVVNAAPDQAGSRDGERKISDAKSSQKGDRLEADDTTAMVIRPQRAL
jgi:hypothetical protein